MRGISDCSIVQMSDVELGGATVFPKFGLRIAPSKVSNKSTRHLGPLNDCRDVVFHTGVYS